MSVTRNPTFFEEELFALQLLDFLYGNSSLVFYQCPLLAFFQGTINPLWQSQLRDKA